MKRWYLNRRAVSLLGMGAAAALLLGAFVLGLVSFANMRKVVMEEFNSHQLVLARNLASLIRQDVDFLERELLVLGQSPSIQYRESPSWKNRMGITLRSVQGGELLEIRQVDSSGLSQHVLDRGGAGRTEEGDFSGQPFFRWALRPENRDRVLLEDSRSGPEGGGGPVLLLRMSTPIYQVSPDEAHPAPGGSFSGVLVFVVDATALAGRFVRDARSGATGYAWVLDRRGLFLWHPEKSFLGKDAFTVRHERAPQMGFETINAIMRGRMLEGEEGMGEYISGWHRQALGPVHKFIAYCPVVLDPASPEIFWSLAVVAPESEVQGLVRSLFYRQLFMQSLIFLAILAGSVSLIRLERFWAQIQKVRQDQVNLSSRLSSLGTLAAGVAHEINNPIAIILGFTDLLLEKVPPGTKEEEMLRIIEKQGMSCKKIVENLGRFARIPEQKQECPDIRGEIERVVSMVENTLLTEKIRCTVDVARDLPPVCGDPQGIQQVLLNLITNAKGAMKQGGLLGIRARLSGDFVEISLSDTGHGIRRRDLPRIFDPFFTTKAAGEGTGLGLSISHGIIEKAGGTLTVESRHEADGGPDPPGTTFIIRLPVTRAAAARSPASH